MERVEAARVLGVAPGASATEVRDAYRRRIRQRHPDHAGAQATDDASAINEAYAVLRLAATATAAAPARGWGAPANPAPAPPPASAPASAPPDPTGGTDDVVLLDDDTMGFAFPADEVFDLLHEVATQLGDVTYADPEAGLLEVRLQFVGLPACSVVLSLQGRADRVEAFSTIEWTADPRPPGSTGPPPDEAVVSLLVRSIRQRLVQRRR